MIGSEEERKSQKRKILIFEDSYALAGHLLKEWVAIAQESVARHNRFTVALSGGRSPMEFYCRLSAFKDFDLWSRTHIFLGDERCVPHDDDSSNFKMIRKNLLDYVDIPPENIHPVQTDQSNPEVSAQLYKDELTRFFEFNESNLPSFDLIILGIGTDGHTASLFPDDKNVDDPNRLVIPVALPHLKEERVSLTLPVINSAQNVLIPVLGANKADMIKTIIKEKSTYPASKVNPTQGQLTWLLDKEAAQQLSYQDSYTHEGQAILLQDPDLRSETT